MDKYALLGEKLSHSFSPQIHKMLGDYEYELYETSADNLEKAVNNPDYKGYNVTIPYKKTVMPLLDIISEEALKIGSVNTIVKKNGRLYGYNTDYYGFEYLLKSHNMNPRGLKVLVLGNGGACATVKAVLRDMGAAEIVVISRKGENNYSNLDIHRDAEMIVNTTPVGMYPNNGNKPVELKNFPKCRYVADLIYNPLRTRLVMEAGQLGMTAAGGISMLVTQAKRASELFTGEEISSVKEEKVIRKIIRRKTNLVLMGMPGCGKSTIGHMLAEKTGHEYYDTDSEIEKEYGINISDFIREKGEAPFREIESRVVKNIGKVNHGIISIGGGAILSEENYYNLQQNSVIVWIKRDLSKLPVGDRPISQQMGVEKLYEIRKPIYQKCADIIIENTDIISSLKKLEDIINNENFGN